ncbi:MAG: phosphatidate cytidylyltransferase [Rhodospirillales bacterium]|nr:phosphatidate cytidylyltransferase [Rhodospirillales bacterium]
MIFGAPAPAVLWTLAAIFGLLLVASLAVAWLDRRGPGGPGAPGTQRELVLRVRSWWLMAGIFGLALVLSETAALVLFGFVSFIALKEYLSLIPTRRADRRVLFWAYLAIPVQYLWVGLEWYGMFIIFVPVYMFLGLAFRMVLEGATEGFLRAAGTLHWGLMIALFSLSHAAYLLALPADAESYGGGAGLLLFLVVLTEANDVFQFLWGRGLGRRPVMPKVSPNKTWAGLLGGAATTLAAALLVAPWLTPFTWPHAALAGLIIGLGGFCGDVTISAVKRDLGVKDSGSLLPGHGGMLDRVDSLTFTAPLFFHFTYYFYF